jgi:hypothetical protein
MILPPTVLFVAALIAPLCALGDWALRSNLICDQHPGEAKANRYAAISAVSLLGVGIAIGLHKTATLALYHTLAWGEPPDNRSIHKCMIRDERGIERPMLELRSKFVTLGPELAAVVVLVNDADKANIDWWFGKSRQKTVIPCCVPAFVKSLPANLITEPKGAAGWTWSGGFISPGVSLYLRSTGDDDVDLIGVWFGQTSELVPEDELSGFRRAESCD